jgi:hypothetical protein
VPRHRQPTLLVTLVPRWILTPARIQVDPSTGAERVVKWRLAENPAFVSEEIRFVLGDTAEESFRKGQRTGQPSNWGELLRSDRARLTLHLVMLEEWREQLRSGHRDTVLYVVRLLGLKTPPEERGLGRFLRQGSPERRIRKLRRALRARAARIVEGWRRAARVGSGQERTEARALIKRVDGVRTHHGAESARRVRKRGRPSSATHPRDIVVEYRRQLFLWRQVRALLGSYRWFPRSWHVSHRDLVHMVVRHYGLKALARRAGLSLEDLLYHNGVRPDGSLAGSQPLQDWEVARLLTARFFKITVSRVENIAAGYILGSDAERPVRNFVK